MIFAFVFSSPVTLFTILFPLIPLVFDNLSDLYYLYAFEIVTLIPRLYFARRTWIGAIARLDGNEFDRWRRARTTSRPRPGAFFPHPGAAARRVALALSGSVLIVPVLAVATVGCAAYLRAHGYPLNDLFGATFFMAGWWVGAMFCAAAPFRLEHPLANGHILRSNYHDYFMAGFGGAQILVAWRRRSWPASTSSRSSTGRDGRAAAGPAADRQLNSFLLSFFILAPTLFNLFEVSGSASRCAAQAPPEVKAFLLALMVFSSPTTVYIGALPILLPLGLVGRSFVALIPLELISIVVRFIVIDNVWDYALDRLEMRLDPWLNTESSTATWSDAAAETPRAGGLASE